MARLETLDRLSLHFCMNPQQDALIEAVPVNEQGDEVDLELHAEGSGVVAIDAVSVSARSIVVQHHGAASAEENLFDRFGFSENDGRGAIFSAEIHDARATSGGVFASGGKLMDSTPRSWRAERLYPSPAETQAILSDICRRAEFRLPGPWDFVTLPRI